MDWAGVISNPLLQNLPFKIELNKLGKILMSPANNSHLQFEIGAQSFASHGYETPCKRAPESCVEIMSLLNYAGDK